METTRLNFPAHPYPGARPNTSFVVNRAGLVHTLLRDLLTPSGWRLKLNGQCLEQWLVDQGAEPLSARVPVLSYGSNACPSKILRNHDRHGVSLPSVNIRCAVRGWGAVHAERECMAGHVPATLVPLPGRREHHFLTYVLREDLKGLDRVEGAPHYYERTVMPPGSVIAPGRRILDDVSVYIGVPGLRGPAFESDGSMTVVFP
jgi:hypothetical protein